MNKRKLPLLVFFVFLCVFAVKADIAPDPGYTNVSVNLILKAQEDFPEYRFFLQSPIDIEEIFIKKGETKIDSKGRGGAKRYVKLLAVPKNSLAQLSALVTGEDESFIDLKVLHKEIQSKKIEGVIELVSHSFQKTVSVSERGGSKNSIYRLEKDDLKGIKAIPLQAEGVSFGFYDIKKSYTPLAMGLMVGSGFISAAVIFLGIWFFRRKRQKLV